MCVRIYLDLHTSSVKLRLTIQLIWFADFTYNYLANYLHTDLLQPPLPPQDLLFSANRCGRAVLVQNSTTTVYLHYRVLTPPTLPLGAAKAGRNHLKT
jgi:hypothetical protein